MGGGSSAVVGGAICWPGAASAICSRSSRSPFLGTRGRLAALASLGAVAVLAVLAGTGQHETAQITLRGTVLLLVALVSVTGQFDLDAVLGAFLAGVVLRQWVGQAAPQRAGDTWRRTHEMLAATPAQAASGTSGVFTG